jgi:hypothetical protein
MTHGINKGGILSEAQDVVPCNVKPFLRTKRVDGNGKEHLLNETGDMLMLKVL